MFSPAPSQGQICSAPSLRDSITLLEKAVGILQSLESAMPPELTAAEALPSPASATIGTGLAIVDAENISNVLGRQVLLRKPRSDEWPDWQRVAEYLTERGCANVTDRRYFFNGCSLQSRLAVQKLAFLRVIAQWFDPQNCDGNVDPFVHNQLRHQVIEGDNERRPKNVLLLAHDGGYAPLLRDLLAAGVNVEIIGFPEFMSSELAGLEQMGATLTDLELDVRAFAKPLRRWYKPIPNLK